MVLNKNEVGQNDEKRRFPTLSQSARFQLFVHSLLYISMKYRVELCYRLHAADIAELSSFNFIQYNSEKAIYGNYGKVRSHSKS